ncbi:MAG: DUF1801 domain-containing protein [Candidatus Nomurabacteria bacterium]|nr:MAG: DUF1801 domain-containing protein [Candidatus Nomurabacteria bacterium]
MAIPKPTTVTEFINAAPKETRAKMRELRAIIRKTAPDAVEGLKWSMPSYSYRTILLNFGPAKTHIGIYPGAELIKTFAKELTNYKTSAGTIQFPLDKPLPKMLIKKIVKYRMKQVKDGKVWKG